jgi:hypothetical protein
MRLSTAPPVVQLQTGRRWRRCLEKCPDVPSPRDQVILFRGAERNRRRGFHNLWVFYRHVQQSLSMRPLVIDSATAADMEFDLETADPVGEHV